MLDRSTLSAVYRVSVNLRVRLHVSELKRYRQHHESGVETAIDEFASLSTAGSR